MIRKLQRKLQIPQRSQTTEAEYKQFIENAYALMLRFPQYFAPE